MVRTVGYAYPWDVLGDPDALARLVDVDAVAVAASYHATRAATPLHARHRTVEVAHAACYVPIRPAAWAGAELAPLAPGDWSPPDAFGTARAALGAAGNAVHAWTVLTHNSALGRRYPHFTVRNAFGERYRYALCPAAGPVLEYCRTLVTEIGTIAAPDGFVLEACGPLGVEHGGEHDKLELGGWSPAQRALLSICFCAACGRRYRAAGLDPDDLAAAVRAGVDLRPDGRDAPRRTSEHRTSEHRTSKLPDTGDERDLHADIVAALGPDRAATLAAVRLDTTGRFVAAVVDAARTAVPGARITLHAAADPWATGAFPGVPASAPGVVDAVVALPGHDGPAVGAYLRGDTAPGVPAAELVEGYRALGATELHLYQLGSAAAAQRQRLLAFVRDPVRTGA